MSLVSEDDVSKALDILGDETGAAARAAHNYFDELTKSVLAEVAAQSNETSAAAREAWARHQEKYLEHLKQVAKWAKEDFRWRQRYAAAEAKIAIFQTMSANSRAMGRI